MARKTDFFLLRLCLFLILSSSVSAQIIYVDLDGSVPGPRDGSSWSNAFATVSAGLAAASSGDQVWVANGTYTAASTIDMVSGVEVYGGFEGFNGAQETALVQRDPDTNTTEIDGLLAIDHVIRFNGTTNVRLDGFRIENGLANGGGVDSNGGGTICLNADSSNVIANCFYFNNAGELGGAIYCDNSPIGILNCRFVANSAVPYGASIALYNGSGAQVVNCTFVENDADDDGAGVHCDASNPSIVNCVFFFNNSFGSTFAYGGTVSCDNNSDPFIANCIFGQNTFYAVSELDALSEPTISRCIFYDPGVQDYVDENYNEYSGAVDIEANVANTSNLLDTNPSFVNENLATPRNSDFHLQASSIAIDAGEDVSGVASLATIDFKGDARGFDGDTNCTITGDFSDYDIGVDEYRVPAADIFPSQTSVNFGNLDVLAGASSALDAVINNIGDADLTFSTVDIVGTNAGDFSFFSGPDTTNLSGGTTRGFSITFDPSATGARTADLRIINNDTCSGTVLISLSGIGTITPDIDVSPVSLAFGSTDVTAGTTGPLSITVQNTGTDALSFSSITIGGTHASDFSFTSGPDTSNLGVSGTRNYQLNFDPSATGARSATVTFNSNDPDEPAVVVNLSGTGTLTPDIDVSPASLAFGSIDVDAGSSGPLSIVVENTGTADIVFTTIDINGTDATDFSFASGPDTTNLAAGTSRTYQINYDPALTGTKSASVRFISNDPDEGTVTVSLSGDATAAPEIDVFEGLTLLVDGVSSLDIGTTDTGPTTLSLTFRVQNNGSNGSNLTITGLSVDAPFVITEGLVSDLDVGLSDTFTVSLPATTDGFFSGDVTIQSNDSDENPFTFEVFGDILPVINPAPPGPSEPFASVRHWEIWQ